MNINRRFVQRGIRKRQADKQNAADPPYSHANNCQSQLYRHETSYDSILPEITPTSLMTRDEGGTRLESPGEVHDTLSKPP